MPFTLGGDGTILPPRKKQSENLGMARPATQVSQPAFVEPDLKVKPAPDGTQLPAGTPSNVFAIARRKAKTLPEAVQSAVAQSGGAVVPLANIKTRVASSSSGYRGPSAAASPDTARLCLIVFTLEAAKRGRGLTVGGKELSAKQVERAAAKLVGPVQAALTSGTVSAEAYKACSVAYCKQYGCEDVSLAPPPQPPPATPPSSGDTSQPPPSTPPSGGDTSNYVPGTDTDERPPPEEKKEPAPEKKSSNTLWWLVALIGGGLLIKKLAAVKVVGAAMAGAPLVAELESDREEAQEHDETEAEEADENEE